MTEEIKVTIEEMFDEWFGTFDPDSYDIGRVGSTEEIREVMFVAYKAGFEKATEFDWL